MDFTQSPERRMLEETLARLFAARRDMAGRHADAASEIGFSREIWAELADLGAIGALLPPEAGGYCGSGFDIAAVFEQVGAALAPEPFLPALLAGRLLADLGADDLCAALIEGRLRVSVALGEPGARHDMGRVTLRAAPGPEGGALLSGRRRWAPHGGSAELLLVPALEAEGLSVFALRPGAAGATVQAHPAHDGGRLASVALEGAAAARIGAPGAADAALERAIALGVLALCAEAVGAMERTLALVVEHLRTRRQFGRPIGEFQALRHRVADLGISLEQARSAVVNAAAAAERGRREREMAVSAAKAVVGRAGALFSEEAVQMHGGMGMCWEHPAAHYAKRLALLDHALGDVDHHLERYAALSRAG